MLALGSLTVATPLALLALVFLPGLWWLLRLTPPAPRRIPFPPVRFLGRLVSTEESAARTPPWLLVLRIVLALAVILGSAHPLINAGGETAGSGPLVLMVDDGWAAARDWPARHEMLIRLIDGAEREGRSVAIVATAKADADGPRQAVRLTTADEARRFAQSLQPKPWQVDRAAAVEALAALAAAAERTSGTVVWLTDGLDEPDVNANVGTLAEKLKSLGTVTVISPSAADTAMILRTPKVDDKSVRFPLIRPHSTGDVDIVLRATSKDGGLLARKRIRIADGDRRGDAELILPAEFRSRLGRVEIEGENTAAAVFLVDERWQRRPVGLVIGNGVNSDQPLLGSDYYLERALTTLAEVRRGNVRRLLDRELAVLVMTQPTGEHNDARDMLVSWIESGGVLLRFAGPEMMFGHAEDGSLLPVELRGGDRAIGGALSWNRPARLTPFPADSPFFGLVAPADVEIRRQVLAQPSLDLSRRTWAQLDDGTPLVTGVRRGEGWIVLVHTTANAEWSDLPLSGLFVDMLERIIGLSRGVTARLAGPPLVPMETLDGFGRLGPASPGARAIAPNVLAETRVGPRHPPGIYGTGEGRIALNLSDALPDPNMLEPMPQGIAVQSYGGPSEIDLRPWLLGLALLLAVVDLAVSMASRGLLQLPGMKRGGHVLGMALVVTLCGAHDAAFGQATVADGSAIPASLATQLAYVVTGDAEVDAVSRSGLAGLSTVVNRRTAAELGPPAAVDPETDELVFYPLLYWPLGTSTDLPSRRAAGRLAAYMRSGGTILFDTRTRGSENRPAELRELAAAIGIPPLIPAPPDHLLGRSYYLLSEFPGRWTGGTVWVEPGGALVNDGVTTVIAGSHDWAGAWAVDEAYRPIFAVVPGGERQRELAYRFGINVVMHVLTGSYKADQVHLPAILERLGR